MRQQYRIPRDSGQIPPKFQITRIADFLILVNVSFPLDPQAQKKAIISESPLGRFYGAKFDHRRWPSAPSAPPLLHPAPWSKDKQREEHGPRALRRPRGCRESRSSRTSEGPRDYQRVDASKKSERGKTMKMKTPVYFHLFPTFPLITCF